MGLAHRQAAELDPAPVELVEPRVPGPVRMLLELLDVEEFQGDAGLAPLGMEVGGSLQVLPQGGVWAFRIIQNNLMRDLGLPSLSPYGPPTRISSPPAAQTHIREAGWR